MKKDGWDSRRVARDIVSYLPAKRIRGKGPSAKTGGEKRLPEREERKKNMNSRQKRINDNLETQFRKGDEKFSSYGGGRGTTGKKG